MEYHNSEVDVINHEKSDVWTFYTAILDDDVSNVCEYLNSSLLVKGNDVNKIKFNFSEDFDNFDDEKDFECDVNTLVSLPLHVAVVNGSRCVIRHLLSRDVDFFACDNNNNNILHSLIAVAHTHKNQREAKAAQTYDWWVKVSSRTSFSRLQNIIIEM